MIEPGVIYVTGVRSDDPEVDALLWQAMSAALDREAASEGGVRVEGPPYAAVHYADPPDAAPLLRFPMTRTTATQEDHA